MLTYRLGAASYAGGEAMARYLGDETLSVTEAEGKSLYYTAEHAPRTRAEELGAAVHRGEMGFSEALDMMVQAAFPALPAGADFDIDEIEDRLSVQLADGVTRANFAEEVSGQTTGVLKPGISKALARRLGIDPSRPLSLGAVASLMSGLDAAGGEIIGKHRRSPMVAVGAVFGVSATVLPTAAELNHILAGRRVDGEAPHTVAGKPMPSHVIGGAQRRFRAAVGLSFEREPTAAEWAHVASGKMASGAFVDMDDYRRAITGTRQPIGFADMTFSASKSLSTAWGLGSDADRAALLDVHARAVDDTMRFIADQLGWARKGAGGRDGVERAELAWVSYQHYTSRPTENITRTDAAGNQYTDPREIPTMRADPNIHTHVVLLNHALVPETGRLGSIDFDRMKGLIHQGGEVYRAYAAQRARARGIEIKIGEHGDAQMSAVAPALQRLFSKRRQEAHEAARKFAAEKGLDWEALGEEQKIGLLRVGASETRNDKHKDAVSDFDSWRKEAAEAGFVQASVLHQKRIVPALSPERRHEVAREALQPMVEKAFRQSAVIDGDAIRALAARSMIVSGIGERAGDEISAVTKLLRKVGVRQDGEPAALVWDRIMARGKERTVVSTDRHLATENDVVALARTLAANRSPAEISKYQNGIISRYQYTEIARAGGCPS